MTDSLQKSSIHRYELAILFLFMCSGFSALIYESVWTHYLKLIFGHAAYAQSLVLSIFMGGLTTGALLASRYSAKIKSPLIAYAIIEAIIGFFALFFHDFFIIIQNILFNTIGQDSNSIFYFTSIKWLFGILLILPQSILLGATFPLITSGILHISSKKSGEKISLLYFNNSLGASAGALVSGFFLIQTVGLPGTILTAGLINLSIAFAIYFITKNHASTYNTTTTPTPKIRKNNLYYLMLGTAFFTGLASFFYEIAWIRMLTLILGATTHAFELMISAFVLGLALGSLWIKKRIDNIKAPVIFLFYIQILMATSALFTVVFYESLFDLMEYIFKTIKRSEEGYGIFIIANHLFSLIVMLPATFFAGMTLPLITNILYKKHNNEKVIGQVYAINTLGAIIGIIIAMNILLPTAGTKGVVGLGSLVDFLIAVTLLAYAYKKNLCPKPKIQLIFVLFFSALLFQTFYNNNTFNPLKTASGVFRTGIANHNKGTEVLFHKDGKLSSVDVIKSRSGHVILFNNGKPDAGISLYGTYPSSDEVTMVLLGALPIAIAPHIRTAANIGMGSGQTAQTLLSYKFISHLDTIEIEKSVIEALPHFEIYSKLPRYDKRSNIIIDDAKTFFSSSKRKYDLIVSEPPNPWVSGVSSLFTTEFYSNIKLKLKDNGILTQWLHLYEINTKTVASVIKALSENFNDYALYNTDDGNIIIIASDKKISQKISNEFLAHNKAKQLLNRIKINSTESIRARYIGNKQLITPYFNLFSVNAATDYFPFLSYQAEKSLFLKERSDDLTSFHYFPIPINQILMGTYSNKTLNTLNEQHFKKARYIIRSKSILENFKRNNFVDSQMYSPQLKYALTTLKNQLSQCQNINNQMIIDSAFQLVKATTPFLGLDDLTILWDKIFKAPCHKKVSNQASDWLNLHKEIATHNFTKALPIAVKILKNYPLNRNDKLSQYVFAAALISAIKTNKPKLAQKLWQDFSPFFLKATKNLPASLWLLKSHL